MNTSITCPDTGAALEFELPGDDSNLTQFWDADLEIHCPVCERVHDISFKQAYVVGVMSRFACIPADIREGRMLH